MTIAQTPIGGLKAVFLDHRPMLARLLVTRLGSREDAEDALQDMWMKLDAAVAGPVAQPAAYLYRMAANLATDRRIAQQRGAARDTAWLDLQTTADELPDMERTLASRDRLRRVEAAMAEMPDRMRDALRMFRVEGLPQREIAAHLGITISGVEKLLQRSYRLLLAADDENSAGSSNVYRLSGGGTS